MNSRIYWNIRKQLVGLIFLMKKTIYKLIQKIDEYHGLSRMRTGVMKTLIRQIFASIIAALILYKFDILLLRRFALCPISLDMFKDIIIGGMGIAGVILGLYCANISSIFSAKYSNVPKSLARLFQQDVVTKSCIKQIVGYIVLCTVMLLECCLEFKLSIASVTGMLFLTVYTVVAFSVTGNRSYFLSDTFSIAELKFYDLINTIGKLTKRNILTSDPSFQNHYRKIADNDIAILSEIGKYNFNIPMNQNAAMLSFMERVLAIVEKYWESRNNIPFDSLWFEKEAHYKQWHNATESEIRIAISTGTTIMPIEIENVNWFEDKLLLLTQECFEKFIKDKDVSMLRNYLLALRSISQVAGKENRGMYWIDYLSKIQNEARKTFFDHVSNGDAEQEIILSAVDLLCSNYVCMVVGINQYVSSIELDKIFHTCTSYSDYSQCDIQNIPFLNTPECKKLYTQISAELSIEKVKITPDWYIEQTVAAEICKQIGIAIDTISVAVKNIFGIGQELQSEKYNQAATTALSHVFEVLDKCRISIQRIEALLTQLSAKHKDQTIIWNNVSTAKLHEELNDIEEKLPSMLIKCSASYAISHLSTRDAGPDFLGLCYNHVSEALVRAMETNNFKKFQEIYKDYFPLVLLYQEYIRLDIIKHKENQLRGIIFKVASAPFFEYALISGLAIIWGEFMGEPCWKNMIDNSLQCFIEKTPDSQKILTTVSQYLLERKNYTVIIENRDILETEWIQRIEQAMSENPRFEVVSDQFNAYLKTDSQLLSVYCGDLSFSYSIELDNPEEVFLITSLNKHLPADQRYHSVHSWEEKYESIND